MGEKLKKVTLTPINAVLVVSLDESWHVHKRIVLQKAQYFTLQQLFTEIVHDFFANPIQDLWRGFSISIGGGQSSL